MQLPRFPESIGDTVQNLTDVPRDHLGLKGEGEDSLRFHRALAG